MLKTVLNMNNFIVRLHTTKSPLQTLRASKVLRCLILLSFHQTPLRKWS